MTHYHDEYRFIRAAIAGLNTYEDLIRRTGRTTKMIMKASAGDLIVCPNHTAAGLVEAELREAQKENIRVVVVDPSGPDMVSQIQALNPRGNKRVYFDHTWSRAFIEASIRKAGNALAMIERMENSIPQT